MGHHRGAVGDLAMCCRLQVDHGRPVVEIRDHEVRQQAGVGAAGADDLDGGLRVLGYLGQAIELASHDFAAADGAVQDALVEDAPELGRTRSVQNCLAGQTGGYLLVEVVEVPAGRALRIARAYSSVCSRPGTTSGSYQRRTVAWASMSAHSWNQPYRRCFWPFFR